MEANPSRPLAQATAQKPRKRPTAKPTAQEPSSPQPHRVRIRQLRAGALPAASSVQKHRRPLPPRALPREPPAARPNQEPPPPPLPPSQPVEARVAHP